MNEQLRRAPGWGSFHSAPPYRADDASGAPKISDSGSKTMLRKSRLGKDMNGLVCQECEAEGAVQLDCLHVLCRKCAKEHVHA
jgi:hypothetical protein